MEDVVQAVVGWATKFAVERWPEIAAGGVMIALWRWFMGHKYQRQIDGLRAGLSPPITVNVRSEQPNPQGPTLIDPAVRVRPSDPPETRFREIECQIKAFAMGQENRHEKIWDLHIILGEIGIPWPGPGVTPEFRRAVSKELLAACQAGNMEAARSAWAKAAMGEIRE